MCVAIWRRDMLVRKQGLVWWSAGPERKQSRQEIKESDGLDGRVDGVQLQLESGG